MDTSWTGEAGLHSNRIKCKKNPGHLEFIPVQEFNLQHLGPCYQDNDIVDLIKCIAALTVRIRVLKLSPKRPPPPYPPIQRHALGAGCSVSGSGFVWRVSVHTEKDKYKETCPCRSCKNSPTPQTRWGQIYIRTVVHVVYDDIEAAETLCHFDLDAPDTELSSVPTVGAREVAFSEFSDDLCSMIFLTHDLALVEKLHKLVYLCDDLEMKVSRKYKINPSNLPDKEHNLTIIVSHPHGCSKCVTVGQCTTKKKTVAKNYNTQYYYTTPSCSGSSGAPVYILGKCWLTEAPHSAAMSTGNGRSAIWF